MILNDYKDQFIELLYEACILDINNIKNVFNSESCIAYTIICDSAFVNFGTGMCTKKRLLDQTGELMTVFPQNWQNKDETLLYVNTHASEWNHFNEPLYFKELNELADLIANADCDGDLLGIYVEDDIGDDNAYNNFFIDFICEVITRLKSSNIFLDQPFQKNLLLGLQFLNPTDIQQKIMLDISERVNSQEWHKKMLEAYSS